MPNLKDLRNRISSVKATRKITKAMQMVAAAKLRRAQEAAEAARPYAERMDAVLSNLAEALKGLEGGSPLMIGTGKDGKVPESLQEEFRNAWTGIGRLLEHCGIGYDDIVEYTSYHVGLHATVETFMSVRDEFLSEPWPAWTALIPTG